MGTNLRGNAPSSPRRLRYPGGGGAHLCVDSPAQTVLEMKRVVCMAVLLGFSVGCSHPRAFPSVRVPPPPSEEVRGKTGKIALVTEWATPVARFQKPMTIRGGADFGARQVLEEFAEAIRKSDDVESYAIVILFAQIGAVVGGIGGALR